MTEKIKTIQTFHGELKLRSTNLTRANLQGADLTGAILEDADLTGANLSNANLNMTDLTGANLSNANLTNTNLKLAKIKNTILPPINQSVSDAITLLKELRNLRNGWLGGKKGLALNKTGLDWLMIAFQKNYPSELIQPYIYPTAEGGVQAEWSLNDWEISLEIDLVRHLGEWHALSISNKQEQEKTLNLDEIPSWQWIEREITNRTN